MKSIIQILALTDLQVDRLIAIIEDVVKFTLQALAALLPIVLLYFQRKNKVETSERLERVERKVEEGTARAEDAFTAANGHNEKIQAAQELVATVVKAVVTPKEIIVKNDVHNPVPTTRVD